MTGRDLIAEVDAIFADLDFALERLFEVTGDNRVRHAALILRGRKGGRPKIDDAEALAEIERLVSAGKPMRHAVAIAARQFQAVGSDLESAKHRLRRKLRKKSRTEQILSAPKSALLRLTQEVHDAESPNPHR